MTDTLEDVEPGPPRWSDYIALEDLPDDVDNPKGHTIPEIMDSILRFGFTEAPLRDERTGLISAGHGRKRALLNLEAKGVPLPDGILAGPDGRWRVPVQRGWASKNDEEARAYLITSNRLTEIGGWITPKLADILGPLAQMPGGLTGTGFTPAEVEEVLAQHRRDAEDDSASAGSLLALSDVTFGEPTTQVEPGQVWLINERHHLCCLDVMTDHALWAPYLTPDALFVPYPGPFAALTERALTTPFVMVQPDRYIAGHIIDKFVSVHGIGGARLL